MKLWYSGAYYLDSASNGTVLTLYHSQRAKMFSVVTDLYDISIDKSYH